MTTSCPSHIRIATAVHRAIFFSVVALLQNPERAEAMARLARPQTLPGGVEPEERLVIGGIGWDGHLALDEAFGHDRPGPRFFYLNGDLEIVCTSIEHERIKATIAGCVNDFQDANYASVTLRGSATMRLAEEAGAEPADSWCLGEPKRFPNLVLEIVLMAQTSGGLSKLEIYQRFAVPEVWIWRRDGLEVHCLRTDGFGYERMESSRLLDGFPLAALEAAVAERDYLKARRGFRAAI